VNQIAIRPMPAILAVVALSFVASFVSATETRPGKNMPGKNILGRTNKPNIVLIYSDDVDCETLFGTFPEQDSSTVQFKNLKELAKQGTRFSNFHVTTPVCGPSRACLYSGQYAHRNQCRVNDPKVIYAQGFTGGYTTFDRDHELATWMKDAGYATAHVGKYLHSDFVPDYQNGIRWRDIIPQGWDHFRVAFGSKYFNFPSYTKSADAVVKGTNNEYRTDWDIRQAIDVIEKHSSDSNEQRPLFLCWTPIAAHITSPGDPMTAPRHESLYTDAQVPDLQQRLEWRVKNPIEEMSTVAVPDAARVKQVTRMYRDRLRATQSIDEGIGKLRRELQDKGMLENTIFIFTSDHGFRLAQNMHFGKRWPYDRITRVPFFVTGPGVPKDHQCDTLLANIDIAPTLVKLAGAEPPESCDGKAFSNLIFDPDQDPSFERDGILIENWGNATSFGAVLPATYSSIRKHDCIYTEWASGGREFYDLAADPQQQGGLRNADSLPKFTATHCTEQNRHRRLCASFEPVEFSGFVESDAGTKSVELEIKCKDTGRYWSKDGWSKELARLTANMDQANGLISSWNFSLNTFEYAKQADTRKLLPREVSVSILATDLQQRQTTVPGIMDFSLAFADPETTLDDTDFEIATRKLTVSGTARGIRTIPFVRIGVQHPLTLEYWDGTTWKEKFCQLDAEVSEPDSGKDYSWKLSVEVPKIPKVILIARAYNELNHSDYSPAMGICTLVEYEYQRPGEP